MPKVDLAKLIVKNPPPRGTLFCIFEHVPYEEARVQSGLDMWDREIRLMNDLTDEEN